MRYVIMSVYDSAAQGFGRPMFGVSVGSCVRSFVDEVNREAVDNVMFGHSEDFLLYELGGFDDSDGSFDLLSSPRIVSRGADVFRRSSVVASVK